MQNFYEGQSSRPDQVDARDAEDTGAGANETNFDDDTPVGKVGIPKSPPSTLELSAPPGSRRQRPSIKYLIETSDDFEDLQDSGLIHRPSSRPSGSFNAWRCVSTFFSSRELADELENKPECNYTDGSHNKVQVWYPQYISECFHCGLKQGEPF